MAAVGVAVLASAADAQEFFYAGQSITSRMDIEMDAAVETDRLPTALDPGFADARRTVALHDVAARVRVRCFGANDGRVEVFQRVAAYSETGALRVDDPGWTLVPQAGFLRRSGATTVTAYASGALLEAGSYGVRDLTVEIESPLSPQCVLWASAQCSLDAMFASAALEWSFGRGAFLSVDGALSVPVASEGWSPEIHLMIGL
jgi:hypothetical protein